MSDIKYFEYCKWCSTYLKQQDFADHVPDCILRRLRLQKSTKDETRFKFT